MTTLPCRNCEQKIRRMNPAHYNQIDDFIEDPSFRDWVRRGGFQRPDEAWSWWLAQHPEKQETAYLARQWLLATHVNESAEPDQATQRIIDQTLDYIRTEADVPVRPLWPRRWLSIAASIALIGLIGGLWYRLDPTKISSPILSGKRVAAVPADSVREWMNRSDRPLLVALPDGSSVMLQPGSRLLAPAQFRPDQRRVTLVGDAFFEVAKNRGWPFFVQTSGLTVRVVGTSFRIRESGKQTTVSVHTGLVTVTSVHRPAAPVTLKPNQHLVFNPVTQTLSRSISNPASTPTSLLETQAFIFRDAPVSTIFASLERAYGIVIDFDKTSLSHCFLTTSLDDEPLAEKLHILCEALGGNSHYSLTGNRVIISSNGCQ